MSLDVDPSLPYIRGDKARLEQAICNLLSNASKYGKEGGLIDLRAACDGERVRISFDDDGRGIPAEFLPRIFDRFEQGDASLPRTEGGLKSPHRDDCQIGKTYASAGRTAQPQQPREPDACIGGQATEP